MLFISRNNHGGEQILAVFTSNGTSDTALFSQSHTPSRGLSAPARQPTALETATFPSSPAPALKPTIRFLSLPSQPLSHFHSPACARSKEVDG